eukprot:gene10107-14007_t
MEAAEILPLLAEVLPDYPDPDMLEYMAGMLEEGDTEDLAEGLTEFLDEYAESDEAKILALVTSIRQRIFGASAGDGPTVDVEEESLEPKKLETSVMLAKGAKEAEALVAKEVEQLDGSTSINTNTELEFWEDPNAPKFETPEEMMYRMRLAKKSKRTEKRRIARERKAAPMRNALMEKLTQKPVVIHGMVDEYGNYGGNPEIDIVMPDISIDLGGIVLFEDAQLTLVYGRRYGLIGRNGSGKTTFLKYLAAKEIPGIPWYIQILHISQEIHGGHRSAMQTLLDCDVERTALLREKAILEGDEPEPGPDDGVDADGVDGGSGTEKSGGGGATDSANLLDAMGLEGGDNSTERLVDIYDRLDEIDADTAPTRAAIILSGLSFTPEMMDQPTSSLSGGWRMRVSLARALFIEPDMLLLDEPTNHLDLHATVWLEEYLRTYKKALVVVSHARDFLNEIATDILELSDKKIHRFKGDFDTYELTKSEAATKGARQAEKGQKEQAKLQAFINKNIGGGAKAATMAKSRQKMLDRMDTYTKATPKDVLVKFKIPTPGTVGGGFGIRLVGVGFGYPGQDELFTGVEFSINQNSRICLVGPNGIGKSTLLNLIYEELAPTTGMVTRNPRLKVERFSQHHVDGLTMRKSILEYMQEQYPSHNPQKIRGHLGAMGVLGELQVRPVFSLSGGQKSRIALAMITYTEPHLLLLDEPTNHLDLDTVQGLIRALAVYKGGVLVVSHDEHMISAVCDELWIIQDKKVILSKGDFQGYKKQVVGDFHKGKTHPAAMARKVVE